MIIPQAKAVLLGEAQAEVQRVIDQYQEGLITDGERYNKIVDIWAGVADKVTQEMMQVIGKEKVVDVETGKATPAFAQTFDLGCAFADGESMWVFGVDNWDGENIYLTGYTGLFALVPRS